MCAVTLTIAAMWATSAPIRAVAGAWWLCAVLATSLLAPPRERLNEWTEALACAAMGLKKTAVVAGRRCEDIIGERGLRRAKAVRRWVREAKLEFGELKDREADRIVLKRWLGERMRAADMRTKDAVQLIPLVVETFMLPTKEEVEAAAVGVSAAAGLMRAALERPLD